MSSSVTGIIGGVVGGVVGFFVGGPAGALAGASLGFGLGAGLGAMNADMPGMNLSGVDPVQADVKTPGSPQTSELEINTTQEGLIVPDLLGTSKISGNILHWENNYNVPIKETRQVYAGTRPVSSSSSSGGGKGGGGGSESNTVVYEPVYQTEEVTVGYTYYLTWAIGICLGPVDALYTVMRNNEAIWAGEVLRSAVGSYTTISIPGMGSMIFYFGTDDQPVNNYAPRRLCYAVFSNCSLGAYNRAPVMRFVIGKRPQYAFSAQETINTYDYNPAHAIWYLLKEAHMAGLPESWLDETTFAAAAGTLYGEGFGISILMDQQQSVLNYVENVLKHVDGVLTYRG